MLSRHFSSQRRNSSVVIQENNRIQKYMLILYVKTGCPFCHKVLATGEELEISFEEKNIADDAVAAELVARGGKQQVPYLVDSERGVEMYESGDIVLYLHEHYAKPA